MAPTICALDTGSSISTEFKPGCWLRLPPLDCSMRRHIVRIVPPNIDLLDPYKCFAHSSCPCNEAVSCAGRVIGVVPVPTMEGMMSLRLTMRTIMRTLPHVGRMSQEAFLKRYTGRRRSRYTKAAESLELRPLSQADANIQAFVKVEKLDPTAKRCPDPRMIQYRNARYGIELGTYLRPMEHQIYRLKSKRGLRVIGKGLTLNERATLLKEKMDVFNSPLVLSIDASRFDKHVGVEHLRLEHSVYRHMNSDPHLRELLKQQLNNLCFTRGGCVYRCVGGRMSGDMNTAVGNCLLMYCMAMTATARLNVDAELLVDGDDTLIICDVSDEGRLDGLTQEFLQYGMEIKLENRAVEMEQVTWCQSKPIYDGSSWRFIRDPRKVLSTYCAGGALWNDLNVRKDVYYSMGYALLAQNYGIPIMQEFALKLMSSGGKICKEFYNSELWLRTLIESKEHKVAPERVNPTTRLSFQEAWGFDPTEQMWVEQAIAEWELPYGSGQRVAPEILDGWTLN